MKKNKVSRAWVNQHVTDHYVHLSKQDGYRSRAAYKLSEIDNQYKLFDKVSTVIDLGCAPGSWSQYAVRKIYGSEFGGKVVGKFNDIGGSGLEANVQLSNRLNNKRLVIGVDLLEIEPIGHLNFILGDFGSEQIFNQIVNVLDGRAVDLIISDMAPNLSGIRGVDQARGSYLVELVLDFAKQYLKPGGNCLLKVFQGGEFNSLVALARTLFTQVIIVKPDASRSKSSETYLFCRSLV
ncbi:MAG: rRNA (uridine2552-2-O)-methyltransferase [Pseudomonadota bacterium]|nr:rRNA (uridine2552-2-O)-methyltransferase [Pseudomonadota bacterium]